MLLVERDFFESRAKAQAAIMAGQIYVEGKKVDKAGNKVNQEAQIEIRGKKLPYVSRGGLKLEKALQEFKITIRGRVCLDIGASTGGFTDCLLQNGAKLVYAIDVGYGQLAWKLQKNKKVIRIDKTNARHLTPEDLYEAVAPRKRPIANLAVIDVSFISLSKILPAVYNLLDTTADIIALIKPQFEAGRERVDKGGIVKDPKVHLDVIESVKAAAEKLKFKVVSLTESPVTGADGNKEFLIHLKK